MRWLPYTDARGRTYGLNHLHPLRYDVTLPCKPDRPEMCVTVHVGFGLHCFTRGTTAADPLHTHYKDGRESRTFCTTRYELSALLPSIARTLATRKCGFARADNYVTIDVPRMDRARYAAFFNLKRWKELGPNAVLVVFQSAYLLNGTQPTPSKGTIGFNALLGHALRGTKAKPPPK